MKPLVGTWALLAAFTLPAIACSSDEDDAGSGGNGGNGTGGMMIGTGGSGGGVGTGGTNGSGDGDGGTVDLPPGRLDELRDGSCAGWSAEPESAPAVLMMVVDVSGSMDRDAPGSNRSKWSETHGALEGAIQDLPGTTGVGMLFFPNQETGTYRNPSDPSTCVTVDELIPVAPLGDPSSAFRDQIVDALDDVRPNGGTPTYDAYSVAYDSLRNSNVPGHRFMLLITDGQPTYAESCVGNGRADNPVDTQPIIDQIAAAASQGIRTFVIGSPGSEETVDVGDDARPWLSRAAEAGGTATDGCSHDGPNYCHFDMVDEPNFGEGLRAALGAIAGQIVQCDYVLPEPPGDQQLDPEKVNVILTEGDGSQQLILRSDASACEEGWYYSDDGEQVLLCEGTCSRVKADAQAGLELLFGCGEGEVVE